MASKLIIMYTDMSICLFSVFLSSLLKIFSSFVNFSVVLNMEDAIVICVAWVLFT